MTVYQLLNEKELKWVPGREKPVLENVESWILRTFHGRGQHTDKRFTTLRAAAAQRTQKSAIYAARQVNHEEWLSCLDRTTVDRLVQQIGKI